MSDSKVNIKTTPTKAISVHVEHGKSHIVGIGNLKVVLIEDAGSWFAQGLEIDYASEGSTIEEAKSAFEKGFCCTIHEHLKVYGSLEKFLTPAPTEVWKELVYDQCSEMKPFYHVSMHDLSAKVATHLPFTGIEYIQKEKAAA